MLRNEIAGAKKLLDKSKIKGHQQKILAEIGKPHTNALGPDVKS